MIPNPSSKAQTFHNFASRGFTLMETVIAIGVLAVLLTGFLAVFTPAAQGIRRSISAQQADRLASTLEQELVTLRPGQTPTAATTGFEKAFEWIKAGGNTSTEAIFVYQYRGSGMRTEDNTPDPVDKIEGQPGEGYTVQSMARRASDPLFKEDLKAIEGSIFYVKPTQLIYKDNAMELSKQLGQIVDPKDGMPAGDAAAYKDAVIAFSAEFFSVPTKSESYLTGTGFKKRFDTAKRPVFTRNLAVRR